MFSPLGWKHFHMVLTFHTWRWMAEFGLGSRGTWCRFAGVGCRCRQEQVSGKINFWSLVWHWLWHFVNINNCDRVQPWLWEQDKSRASLHWWGNIQCRVRTVPSAAKNKVKIGWKCNDGLKKRAELRKQPNEVLYPEDLSVIWWKKCQNLAVVGVAAAWLTLDSLLDTSLVLSCCFLSFSLSLCRLRCKKKLEDFLIRH